MAKRASIPELDDWFIRPKTFEQNRFLKKGSEFERTMNGGAFSLCLRAKCLLWWLFPKITIGMPPKKGAAVFSSLVNMAQSGRCAQLPGRKVFS